MRREAGGQGERAVKLMYFHLMPYPHLPDDFREKHPSVWIDIDPALFDRERMSEVYNDYIDELIEAAELGFDAVCVNEHHSNGYGLMPSPNLIASTLARQTRDSAICILGNSLALYNPPIRVAEEMAMVDCISGGRVIAGFPVGTPMDTCYAYGQNPSQLRARYAEAHDLIVRSWTEPKVFSFNGRFNKLRYVNVLPRPLQRPHPPIWVPGGGSMETWRWCAESDYVYSYLSYFGHKMGRETMDGFWNAMDELGKDRNPYRAGFLQFVGVAETRQEALELYREPAEYFYGRCLRVDPRYATPPGHKSEATMRARVTSQVETLANADAASGSRRLKGPPSKPPEWQSIVDRGYVVIGSPDEVAEQLRAVAQELNVGHLMLLLQFGNMGRQLASYNANLFARRVAPQLQDLFDDRWEDRWWPQGARRPQPQALKAAS